MNSADRVLHVIHSGGFYGAERMLSEHCLALNAVLENRVAFISPPDELLERFRGMGIASEAIRKPADLIRLAGRQPLVLNAHNFKAQLYAWRAARRTGRPLVFTQHGFTPRSLKQKLYMGSSILLCKTRTVNHAVCVADSIVRQHQALHVPDSKISLIPNGLPVRAPLPRQVGKPLIGFAGRLSQEKGPELFLQAVVPLLQQRPGVCAVMLGDGPMRDQLQAQIFRQGLAQRITLAGYQDNMDEWLARLSVLVLSSRTEGTPMVLLEAMRAGVPVAAFSVGGIPDVILHGQEGLLASAGDVTGLSRNIARFLDDSALVEVLARQARLRQQESFSLKKSMQRWQNLYARIAGVQNPC